jgi:hypothetical protein
MQSQGEQLGKEVVQALKAQIPVRGLPGVRIRNVKAQPRDGFDAEFQLESGERNILIYGEIKPAASPKLLGSDSPHGFDGCGLCTKTPRSVRSNSIFANVLVEVRRTVQCKAGQFVKMPADAADAFRKTETVPK